MHTHQHPSRLITLLKTPSSTFLAWHFINQFDNMTTKVNVSLGGITRFRRMRIWLRIKQRFDHQNTNSLLPTFSIWMSRAAAVWWPLLIWKVVGFAELFSSKQQRGRPKLCCWISHDASWLLIFPHGFFKFSNLLLRRDFPPPFSDFYRSFLKWKHIEQTQRHLLKSGKRRKSGFWGHIGLQVS